MMVYSRHLINAPHLNDFIFPLELEGPLSLLACLLAFFLSFFLFSLSSSPVGRAQTEAQAAHVGRTALNSDLGLHGVSHLGLPGHLGLHLLPHQPL